MVVIGLLVVLAAVLRFFRLDYQSLWVDEILSIQKARVILTDGLDAGLFYAHGPLFFYILAAILPDTPSEIILRLPSAIFGTAAVVVTYFLGKRFIGPQGGLVAGLLLAISPFAVWYSQEARYGSLFILMAALSILFAHRYFEDGRRRDLAIYVVATTLALFSFMGAIFLLLAQNVWMLTVARSARRLRPWILGQLVIAVVFVPWLIRAYEIDVNPLSSSEAGEDFSIARLRAGFSRPTEPVQVGYVMYVFGVGYSLGPSVRELHQDLTLRPVARKAPEVAVATLLVGALAVAGVVRSFKTSKRRALFLVLCVACSILGAYGLAMVTNIAYNVRYAAAGFPAFVVLLAWGLTAALQRSRWLGFVALAAVLGLMAFSLAQYYGDPEYAKEDSRGVARLLQKVRKPHEPLIVGSSGAPLAFYYPGPFYRWDRVMLISSPPAARGRSADRIWVAAMRTWERGFKDFLQGMDSCYELERRFDLPGYVLTAYRAQPPAGSTACSLTKIPPSTESGEPGIIR